MAAVDKLNQRSNKFTIVLNDNELHLFKNCKHIVEKFINNDVYDVCFVACIKHDRDIDEENHVKTVHYHVVLDIDKICRVGTMLNWISSAFHCNENQVSIDKCSSLPMQTRYLCHLDDFDKVPYYDTEVVTNNESLLKQYFNMVVIRDRRDLIARVREYRYDLEEIMANFVQYDKYSRYIKDLINNHLRTSK